MGDLEKLTSDIQAHCYTHTRGVLSQLVKTLKDHADENREAKDQSFAAGVRFGLDIAQEHTKTYMREEVKQLSNLKGDPR